MAKRVAATVKKPGERANSDRQNAARDSMCSRCVSQLGDRAAAVRRSVLRAASAPKLPVSFTGIPEPTPDDVGFHTGVIVVGQQQAALVPVVELLTRLSPKNVRLVESIVRCVLAEQSDEAR